MFLRYNTEGELEGKHVSHHARFGKDRVEGKNHKLIFPEHLGPVRMEGKPHQSFVIARGQSWVVRPWSESLDVCPEADPSILAQVPEHHTVKHLGRWSVHQAVQDFMR